MFEASGAIVRRDYSEHFRATAPPPASEHPYLIGLNREESNRSDGTLLSMLFRHTPRRFTFRPGQQEMLRWAISGATDEVHRTVVRRQKLGTSRKTWDYRVVDADSWSNRFQVWASRLTVIDKFTDWYEETVSLPGGRVVHHVRERLTAHRSHGAARPKPPDRL